MSAQSATKLTAIIVQQGKVLDFIDGSTQRNETPEEHVRQEIAKSLVREYRYPKSNISIEYTVQIGTRKPRADIVVFAANMRHEQPNATIIVECKAPSVKSTDKENGVAQLKSYLDACPNTRFGMWINGVERVCFRRIESDGHRFWEEIPDLPRFGKEDELDDRPQFHQLDPASSDALLFAFRRCHNFIAGNQGLQKPQAFWELLKLIFCKIEDENGSEIQFYAGATERRTLNGALKVKARVESLFSAVKDQFPQIFKSEEQIDLDPKVIAYIVSQLQGYILLDSDIDVKGRAYEEIVGSNLRGDRGEFFTPRNICQMAVSMLAPNEKQLICDPACGTGGFLITAMHYVIREIENAQRLKWKNNPTLARDAIKTRIVDYAKKFIVGVDFNPELVKASKMNMVMNNDGAGGLYQANSLENPAGWRDDALRNRKLMGRADLVFTNPPFGSKIQISDTSILEQFDLGHKWSYDEKNDLWNKSGSLHKSQPPEILFIERCIQLLKPGVGRAAIVLPDGILGSPGLGYVREWILRNTRILASIDLHPDTFQPFVSIQTSLLILERKTKEQIDLEAAAGSISEYQVFMAVANHIGHDKRGQKTYVRDALGNEMFREVDKQVWEYEDGVRVIRNQKVQDKVLDDNTKQIAEAFRQWLYEHDL
ncbi:N-6 DNA methylase [Methylobacterium sp. E-025]|uniref:N-6 DNA methylase n=1 Tax=Methylobacterium sp. E-025 TaxID=2836561 RepID=UPI001FBA715B|nr:N-6 DNA methylase [Methylobacterium sp. E-025]MCJ2112243.1 N-6 DNA methylase [Methylobacterium sp. E-025]